MKKTATKTTVKKQMKKKPISSAINRGKQSEPDKALRIGIIAPSSVVPVEDFKKGVAHLEAAGFGVEVHPTVLGQDYFYPADDETRAKAFLDFAYRDDLDLIWCARGGYGATHLLPYLKKASLRKKPSPKTFLGYSDATALLEFTRVNWGWNAIHSPMPSNTVFTNLKDTEWASIMEQIEVATRGKKASHLSASNFSSLKPVFVPKSLEKKPITAPIVGGNLAVWNSLIGTPFAGNARGKILFLEEIQENIPRINRMIHHLEQAGGLKGVKAIILGDFLDCHDSVMKVNDRPIRKIYPSEEALDFVFRLIGEKIGIPIWKNAPVGHGPNYHALGMGLRYTLDSKGNLKLV
jgi:muramoyltetrapeptide carboxypeptidase